MKSWIKLAAVVAVLAIGGPAAATHGGIHPTFRTERVYFHCVGSTKVQNVNLVTDGPATWNTTAPTQSVQEGAGCGYLEPGAARGGNQQTVYDAPFVGKFTGNLRDLTVELHNLALGRVRPPGSLFVIRVRGSIDGTPIFPETAGRSVTIAPVVSSTGASEKLLFTIKGIGCAREVLDAEGNVVDVKTAGLATEDGDGAAEHELILTIDSFYTQQASAWVYDTTEVPAGITFNPPSEEAATVRVENPVTC
ncbi:MAG TPA: hypothetical protein VG602_00830 [Actinomycetota bacterium]|nr:hypothetical protein [Actinomycetota bacterium]